VWPASPSYPISACCSWQTATTTDERFETVVTSLSFDEDTEEEDEQSQSVGWYKYLEFNLL